jgi:transcriptional regulator with XRE-family HTH domain
MSNVIEMSPAADHRVMVVGEVRAEMGRKRITASELGRRTGRPQQYWSRRLTGLTALDVDDLATLSFILEVPMAKFVPNVVLQPQPDPENTEAPRPNGPGGVSLPELDSNQQPAGFTLRAVESLDDDELVTDPEPVEHLADVLHFRTPAA